MTQLTSILTLFLVSLLTTDTPISNPQFTGAVPRLTTDAQGNPLISWVEKISEKETAFYFAQAADGQTFGPGIRVKAPAGISSHAEGMPKLAVKTDGTLVAVYEVPNPTPESRFAGDLLYTMSADNGQHWTDPAPVYQTLKPGTSHSYGDITRLPNGEIGLVYLDEKLPGREGRPVMFAQTTNGKGFGPAVLVDDNACQCCRTNVFVDAQKAIHLTYRDLILSNKKDEPASRDISTALSTNGGKTFGKPQRVYADNWQVNACPHAGPAVAQVGNELLMTWFSGKEEAVGLRLARLGSDGLVSSVLSNRAKHPQLATLGNQLLWVWDEAVSRDGSGEMGSFVQRIAMRTVQNGVTGPTTYLTPDTINAAYPAVLATKNGILLAYEQTIGNQKPTIVVRSLPAL
ncbi:sialidase family protein [Spirosoma pulveris]